MWGTKGCFALKIVHFQKVKRSVQIRLCENTNYDISNDIFLYINSIKLRVEIAFEIQLTTKSRELTLFPLDNYLDLLMYKYINESCPARVVYLTISKTLLLIKSDNIQPFSALNQTQAKCMYETNESEYQHILYLLFGALFLCFWSFFWLFFFYIWPCHQAIDRNLSVWNVYFVN